MPLNSSYRDATVALTIMVVCSNPDHNILAGNTDCLSLAIKKDVVNPRFVNILEFFGRLVEILPWNSNFHRPVGSTLV